LKTTWKLIGTIVNRKVSHSPPDIKKLVIEQKSYADKESICDELNTYFLNVGRKLAEELPQGNVNPTQYSIYRVSPKKVTL
jgi:hypothetical protein